MYGVSLWIIRTFFLGEGQVPLIHFYSFLCTEIPVLAASYAFVAFWLLAFPISLKSFLHSLCSIKR
jgi:hypothetical protein